MLSKNKQTGITGELKSMAAFTELGFSVFAPVSDGHNQFDFIACSDSALIRVEVKSTNAVLNKNKSFLTHLLSVRPIGHRYVKKPFDGNKCEILAIYLRQVDTLCFINAKSVHGRTAINLRYEHTKHSNNQWLIDDHTDLQTILNGVAPICPHATNV